MTGERAEDETPAYCCENLEPGMFCQPKCQKKFQFKETALGSDMGLYYKFSVNKTTGLPFGCPGYDEKWLSGKTNDES